MWKVKKWKDEVMILFSVPEPYLLMQPLPRAVWEGYPEWERWTQRRSRWSWLSQRRRLTASSGGSSEDLSYPNPWRHEGKTEAGRESQDKDTDQNMLYHNSRRRHFFCKCIPSLDGFLFRCCHLYLHYLGFVCVESFVQVFFSVQQIEYLLEPDEQKSIWGFWKYSQNRKGRPPPQVLQSPPARLFNRFSQSSLQYCD